MTQAIRRKAVVLKGMLLFEAEILATKLLEEVKPLCVRCSVVGDVHRKEKLIRRIILVVEPLYGDPDLIHNKVQQWSEEPQMKLVGASKREKTFYFHEDNDILAKIEIVVILPPAQFGVALLLETGPQEYVRELLHYSRQLGYSLKDYQLRRRTKGSYRYRGQKGSFSNKLLNKSYKNRSHPYKQQTAIKWRTLKAPTEKSVFKQLEIPYAPPCDRGKIQLRM
jgi:DNA polymerase/3'-5' exonuclease PolX